MRDDLDTIEGTLLPIPFDPRCTNVRSVRDFARLSPAHPRQTSFGRTPFNTLSSGNCRDRRARRSDLLNNPAAHSSNQFQSLNSSDSSLRPSCPIRVRVPSSLTADSAFSSRRRQSIAPNSLDRDGLRPNFHLLFRTPDQLRRFTYEVKISTTPAQPPENSTDQNSLLITGRHQNTSKINELRSIRNRTDSAQFHSQNAPSRAAGPFGPPFTYY